MKRRSSLRSNSGQEERRLDTEHNLRKRKSINYHDDEEDCYYYEEDDCNQSLTHEDRELWPVSCGDKKGMMDVQKLAKSEECIECERRMFTPRAFEEFAGRGSAKKWKYTIYSDGKPLQHWFDEGLLDTEGYKKGAKTYKKKGKTFQNNGDKPAHHLSRRDAPGAGESGTEATDDSENDNWIPSGSGRWRGVAVRPPLWCINSKEGAGDSEMNSCEKTKSSEREKLVRPVESETADVATNTSPQQEPVEEKIHKFLGLSAETLTTPGPSACDNRTAVSCLDQFESQTMSETRSVCDSDSTRISDQVETSTSGVLTGSDADTMDLGQLQRETLKTQLEAARVQKEYYTLKLRLLQVQVKAGRFSSSM
ncbi:hypothetical protein CCH79_00013657 [Gambusia affinis]|uniref:SAND domain-containing protein n=1 Tax=Gambusia affinis TaxID=33528 RepID=A0A315WB36_GAMAF|nr:hypothetical protein CCH79_00013657 [Gambusia affinis]